MEAVCLWAPSLSRVQLFVTAWTVAHQAPQYMGFSRQEYWSGWPCSPPEDLTNPGSEPVSLMSPALAGRFFTTTATLETQNGILCSHKKEWDFAICSNTVGLGEHYTK